MQPYVNFFERPSLRSLRETFLAWSHIPERALRLLTYACAAMMIAILAMIVFAATSAQAASCRNADLVPGPTDLKRAEIATQCLINQERRKRGLKSTRYNKNLRKAAEWQGKDMLRHEYFDHNRNGGPSFVGRISRFGYGKRSNGYSLGENLAWAPQTVATPREMVRMWMESPGHRANILRKVYREQAVAAIFSDGDVGGDYEDSGGPFIVFVSQFGKRY